MNMLRTSNKPLKSFTWYSLKLISTCGGKNRSKAIKKFEDKKYTFRLVRGKNVETVTETCGRHDERSSSLQEGVEVFNAMAEEFVHLNNALDAIYQASSRWVQSCDYKSENESLNFNDCRIAYPERSLCRCCLNIKCEFTAATCGRTLGPVKETPGQHLKTARFMSNVGSIFLAD